MITPEEYTEMIRKAYDHKKWISAFVEAMEKNDPFALEAQMDEQLFPKETVAGSSPA